jgi:hypothetical protein
MNVLLSEIISLPLGGFSIMTDSRWNDDREGAAMVVKDECNKEKGKGRKEWDGNHSTIS